MKKALRKEMIQKRRALPDNEWHEKSHDILKRLTALPLLKEVDTIMIFMDFRKEVQTRPIIEYLWKLGKKVVIPRVKPGDAILELCIINSFNDMALSKLGILEPKESHAHFANPEDIDFVFMPGVAFTMDGKRLGYGGGYYDQLLPRMKKAVPKVALAFDLQIVDTLPTESHDIIIDGILTESGFIDCSTHL
jgi:5-formyltetrahydrofolate cyclo-ligase